MEEMENTITIQTVKIQGQGYLLNGTMHVPKADGNLEYELIKQWLSEGNIPEPEFTEEEIEAQLQEQANAEARAKLNGLDWKVIRELERLMLAGTDLNVEREELRASIV